MIEAFISIKNFNIKVTNLFYKYGKCSIQLAKASYNNYFAFR